jgi:hypothetical protein
MLRIADRPLCQPHKLLQNQVAALSCGYTDLRQAYGLFQKAEFMGTLLHSTALACLCVRL